MANTLLRKSEALFSHKVGGVSLVFSKENIVATSEGFELGQWGLGESVDVLVVEPHHDDAILSAGSFLKKILDLGVKPTVVSLMSDPRGVLDSFVVSRSMTPTDTNKCLVREKESQVAFNFLGLGNNQTNLRAEISLCSGVYDNEGRLRAGCGESKWKISESKTRDLIRKYLQSKPFPQIIIFPYIFTQSPHHSHHHVLGEYFLQVLSELNYRGTILFYETYERETNFDLEGIRANALYFFPQSAMDFKKSLVSKYESQIDRRPYHDLVQERNRSYASAKGGLQPFAERFVIGRIKPNMSQPFDLKNTVVSFDGENGENYNMFYSQNNFSPCLSPEEVLQSIHKSDKDVKVDILKHKDSLKVLVAVPTCNSSRYILKIINALDHQVSFIKSQEPGWSVHFVVFVNGKSQELLLSELRCIQQHKEGLVNNFTIGYSEIGGKVDAINTLAQYARETDVDIVGFFDDDIEFSSDEALYNSIQLLIKNTTALCVGPAARAVKPVNGTLIQRAEYVYRERLFSVASNLQRGPASFLFTVMVPLLPSNTINDGGFFRSYFSEGPGSSDRIKSTVSDVVFYQLSGANFFSYIKRLKRVTFGAAQTKSLFKDKPNAPTQALSNPPWFFVYGLSRGLGVKEKILFFATFLCLWFMGARLFLRIYVSTVVLVRHFFGRYPYSTEWGVDLGTKPRV